MTLRCSFSKLFLKGQYCAMLILLCARLENEIVSFFAWLSKWEYVYELFCDLKVSQPSQRRLLPCCSWCCFPLRPPLSRLLLCRASRSIERSSQTFHKASWSFCILRWRWSGTDIRICIWCVNNSDTDDRAGGQTSDPVIHARASFPEGLPRESIDVSVDEMERKGPACAPFDLFSKDIVLLAWKSRFLNGMVALTLHWTRTWHRKSN